MDLLKIYLLLSVCALVHVHMHAHVCSGTHEGQKRTSKPLELELQAAVSLQMWLLGTKSHIRQKDTSALNQ